MFVSEDSTDQNRQGTGRVKLVAHRGFQLSGPENSIPAFLAAGELGFWAIETDARLTKDGFLVCIHDAAVDRTFDGAGDIKDMTLEELRTLIMDTAAYHVDLSGFSREELKIPLFSDYLRICRGFLSLPFIELKSALTGQALKDYIRQVIDEALAAGFEEKEIILSSAVWEHLAATRELSERVFIHHIFSTEDRMKMLAELGNAGMAFNFTNLDVQANYQEVQRLVNKAHAAGLKACLRAGDNPETVQYMLELGLDYIPTNVTSPKSLPERVPGFFGGI